MSIFDILYNYRQGFTNGLLVTLSLCIIVWSVGLLIGGLIGIAGAHWKKAVGLPTKAIAFVLSGVPVLVFLFWVHYPLQTILGVIIDPFITTAITIATINVFSVAEIIRNSINNLPKQFIEAAKVCGIQPTKRLFKIELPIVLRYALPSLLILQVNMLHLSLFGSLISVDEIFRTCQRINAQIYKPVEIYTALGFFFLLVCLPINGLAEFLKIKFTRDISER